MDTKLILKDLVDILIPLASVPESRYLLTQLLEKSGVKVDKDLNVLNEVSGETLNKLIKNLDVSVVWKLAAKRTLRQHGVS